MKMTSRQKTENPLGAELFGGSAYIVATREFIDWTRRNKTVLEFFDWSRDTFSPDEMVWATLARLPGAPGFRHQHQKWDQNELQTITRIVKWMSLGNDRNVFSYCDFWSIFCRTKAKEEGYVESSVYPRCSGYHRHGICVYGIGDVSWVSLINIQVLYSILSHKVLTKFEQNLAA